MYLGRDAGMYDRKLRRPRLFLGPSNRRYFGIKLTGNSYHSIVVAHRISVVCQLYFAHVYFFDMDVEVGYDM